MDNVVESGGKEKGPSASASFSLGVTNGGLKEYGMTEPLSRNQTLRCEREQGGKKSPISSTRAGWATILVDAQSAVHVMTIHTYVYIYVLILGRSGLRHTRHYLCEVPLPQNPPFGALQVLSLPTHIFLLELQLKGVYSST